ncbi:MAG: hypothetical protein ACTSYI_04045 [Promethearchaeota archaeon]
MIFFDLEFYVPPKDRHRSNGLNRQGSFKFNPCSTGHFLLGGEFISTDIHCKSILDRQSLWLWNFESEQALLHEIYRYFSHHWDQYNKKKNQKSTLNGGGIARNEGNAKYTGISINDKDTVILQKRIRDVITCGFAIARIDLPALFIRSSRYDFAPSNTLFRTFLTTKVIDLSNTASYLFPQEKVLYPKTQREVAQKLLKQKMVKLPGHTVWKQYDQGDYEAIADRCRGEVEETLEIYLQLKKNHKNHKNLPSSLNGAN